MKSSVPTTYSIRIQEAMKLRGMKQADLVRKTNINKGTLSSYLSGRFAPKQHNLHLLAQALEVNEAWLMGADTFMEPLPLNREGQTSGTDEFFQMQIQENSMEPRICAGDIVIVHKQSDADNGDTIIVNVNNKENVCKRLRKYHDGIELISNNPSFAPVFYSTKEIQERRIQILGKVIELWAKL